MSITLAGLDLESGAQYIVIVRAINFAGLQTEAASDGFTVDFTPPATSEARIGTGPEPAQYQSDMMKMAIRYRIVILYSRSYYSLQEYCNKPIEWVMDSSISFRHTQVKKTLSDS